MTTVKEYFEEMRARLQPQGSEQVVKLQLGNFGYLDYETVKEAIDELEHRMLTHPLMGQPSALEKLGILLLTETK